MTRITPHFVTATLRKYTVGDLVFIAQTSTRPGFHVATLDHGFIDPRSLATYATADDAIAEVERRASAAMTPRTIIEAMRKGEPQP